MTFSLSYFQGEKLQHKATVFQQISDYVRVTIFITETLYRIESELRTKCRSLMQSHIRKHIANPTVKMDYM